MKKIAAALLLALSSTMALAVTNAQVFAYAEANFPDLFKGTPSSGQYDKYSYTYYPTSQNYLALDSTGTIYILGPYTNNQIVSVGLVTAYSAAIEAWEKSNTTSASVSCSAATAPAGITYSQNGNTINVTTASCITPPTTSLCNPTAPKATGTNVMVTQSVQTFKLSGLTMNVPGIPNPLDSVASAMGNSTTCMRNAPDGFSSLTINTNVCYDLTDQLKDSIAQMKASGFMSATPPVTMTFQGTSSMKTVADCTTSGASTIVDAFTGQTLIKQANGTYK